MVSERIIRYLDQAGVPYTRRPHARVVTAQELAASVHVSGRRVAKSVLVDVDGTTCIAVLPATEVVDRQRLGEALGARRVRLLEEGEFVDLFPECELGAEPPFGALYGLPVVVDEALLAEERIVFRAGSHEEAIEISYADFARLEQPRVATFGSPMRSEVAASVEGRWM